MGNPFGVGSRGTVLSRVVGLVVSGRTSAFSAVPAPFENPLGYLG